MLHLDAERDSRSPTTIGRRLNHTLDVLTDHWPVVWAAVVLLVGMEGVRFPRSWSAAPTDLAVRVLALLPLGLRMRARPGRIAIWVLVATGAFLGAGWQAGRLEEPAVVAPTAWQPSRWNERRGVMAGRLRADARPAGDDRWSAAATALAWYEPAPAGPPVVGDGVLIRGQGPAPSRGDIIVMPCGLRPSRPAATIGGFDERRWLQGRAISHVALADTVIQAAGADLATRGGRGLQELRAAIRARLMAGLPPPEAGIAAAVLLGDRLASHVRDPFVQLGLAHLFALSGLHVGILTGLGLMLLRPLPLVPMWRTTALAPLLILYALMVDLPGSVVRAVGLVVLAGIGSISGRRTTPLRVLGLVFWLNLLWQPCALLDVGVQLSYLAAGGILIGQAILGRFTRGQAIASAVAVTISAQLATMPVIARAFGSLPLAGPALNLVVVPLFGVAVTVIATATVASSVSAWAGDGLFALGAVLLRLIVAAATTVERDGWGLGWGMADWSSAAAAGHWFLVAALAAVWRWQRRWRLPTALACYAAILAFAIAPRPDRADVRGWQFAVGQGDCGLLEFGDGWRVLVDTGDGWRPGSSPLAREVLPWLRRRNITHVDAVVLTHGHRDHTGGVVDLVGAVDVGRWYVSGEAAPAPGAPALRVHPPDTLHAWRQWSLVAFHPTAADSNLTDENDQSIVLGLLHGEHLRGLWTGDLETGGEACLIPRLPPVPTAGVDVWKAGHHGSETSGSRQLLDHVRPRLVVISTGVANRHHHPSHGPYLVGTDTVPILRTDTHGTVTMSWSAAGFRADPTRSP